MYLSVVHVTGHINVINPNILSCGTLNSDSISSIGQDLSMVISKWVLHLKATGTNLRDLQVTG